MIKENRILFVSKLTKLQFLKEKYKTPKNFLKKDYDNLITGHSEHQKSLNLIKKYFPTSLFIYPWDLTKELTSNFDLIVSIGGDENFKYVVHHSKMNKIFLSFCSNFNESECRLSSYNIHTIGKMVDDIFKGNLNIKNWGLNYITLYESLEQDSYKEDWSMDTIYIGNRLSCNISKYKLIYNEEEECQKSSGILISTFAGSTGWFSAASGNSFPISDIYRSEFLVREIYKGRKKYSNSKIVNGIITSSKNLEIHSFMDEGIINVDWTKEYSFNRGKTIKISLSKKFLKVVSDLSI